MKSSRNRQCRLLPIKRSSVVEQRFCGLKMAGWVLVGGYIFLYMCFLIFVGLIICFLKEKTNFIEKSQLKIWKLYKNIVPLHSLLNDKAITEIR